MKRHLRPSPTPNGRLDATSAVRGAGEMAERVRAFDWSTTPLGAIESWSAALLTSINIVLSAPYPAALFCGAGLRLVYNDCYRDILGSKHPVALGAAAPDVWWDAWDAIEPDVRTVLDHSGSAVKNEVVMPVNRDGVLKDAYWNYSLSPVYEGDGSVAAVLVVCQEVTQAVLAERLLRASENRILHSIGDAVIVTDAAARVTRMNPVAEALTGWTEAVATGVPLAQVFQIVNESTRLPVESPADKVRRLGAIVGLANHTILLRRDGTEVHIDDSAAPIRDEQGALAGIVLVFRDIHERRIAELSLQKSEERFRTLLELSPVGVAITDAATGQLLYTNGEMSRILGYTPAELQTMHSTDLTYSEDREANKAFYDQVQQNLTTGQVVIKRYLHKDGAVIWAQVRTRVIEGKDGQRHILGTIEDISERLQSQKMLEESERRLAVFADAIPALAFMANPDGWISWYNRQWFEYTGTTPAEMEGWGWQSVHDPAVLPAVMERWTDCIASGKAFEMVFPLKGKDGIFRAFLTRVTPVHGTDGEITRWFGTNTEIDALEQTRATLAAERRRLATLIDHLPVGLVFADADGRITGGNRQVEQIIRHPVLHSADADSYGSWVSHHPDGRRVRAEEYPLARTLRDGEVHRGEYLYHRGDGTEGWVQFTSAAIKDEAGHIAGGIVATLDIDERKRAEEALIQNEKLAAVGRLAASIAHEINNPLESVTNILYLLRGTTEGESRQQVDLAERELRRVAAITNQALRFHKQSTHAITANSHDLFTDVLALYQGKLVNSKIVVEMRLRAGSSVLCFDGEIRQVLSNLIGNAMDAMRSHGGRLLLRSREATHWQTGQVGVTLTVADTGTGMPPQTAKRVFEAFFTTKGMGGTGLGLWISHEIIARHKGRLSLRSSQRKGHTGTVFTVFLPL